MTPFSHEVLRLRPRAGVFSRHGSLPRAYADQCMHVGRSFFSPIKRVFVSAAAEQQQTAAVEAQLQLIRKYVYPGLASGMRFSSGKAAAAQRGRWRRGAAATATAARARGNEINAAAAARARGNEINTDRRSNALLTCQFPVF